MDFRRPRRQGTCRMHHLIQALHRKFDVSRYSTSRISLMRWGYSAFTHRTFVRHPLWGCQMFTVRAIAILQDTAPQRSSHSGRTVEPSPGDGLFPTPALSAPARKALTAPSEPSPHGPVPTGSQRRGALGSLWIEPSTPVAKGFGLLIRPCLGASQLNE